MTWEWFPHYWPAVRETIDHWNYLNTRMFEWRIGVSFAMCLNKLLNKQRNFRVTEFWQKKTIRMVVFFHSCRFCVINALFSGKMKNKVLSKTDCGSLTHWDRVTHICVGYLTIIDLVKGLSPGRRQVIIWNNSGILLIVMIHKFWQALCHLNHVIERKNRLLTVSSWKVLLPYHVSHGYDRVSTELVWTAPVTTVSVQPMNTCRPHAAGSLKYEVVQQLATYSM